MVLIRIYLGDKAMEVLFEDALRQLYEAFPEYTVDDRMPVLRDNNQVIFKVVAAMPICPVAHNFSLCSLTAKPLYGTIVV